MDCNVIGIIAATIMFLALVAGFIFVLRLALR